MYELTFCKTRRNRGETLLEVIVAVVLLGIIAGAGMTSFGMARRINQNSGKYIQAEDIAATLLEESANIDFDYLMATDDDDYFDPGSEDCVIRTPQKYTTASVWALDKASDDEAVLTLTGLNGTKAHFKAVVEIDRSSYTDNYNDQEFIRLSTISDDNSCVIDFYGTTNLYSRDGEDFVSEFTASDLRYFLRASSSSFDKQAVQHFSSLNTTYVSQKWKAECDRIDAYNALHADEGIIVEYPELGTGAYVLTSEDVIREHLNKETFISVRKNSLFHFITVKIKYSLQQNIGTGWVPIIEDESVMANPNRTVTYTFMSDSKYIDLQNIYLMYVPLASDWHSDKITLENGTELSNGFDFNFYLVQQPFDSDGNELAGVDTIGGNPLYSAPDVTVTAANPLNRITLYTNTNLSAAATGLAGKIGQLYTDKVHILESKYTRLFEIKVSVYDETKNSLLCMKETSILR